MAAAAQPSTRLTVAQLAMVMANDRRIRDLAIKEISDTNGLTDDEKIEKKDKEEENDKVFADILVDIQEVEKNQKLIGDLPNAIPEIQYGKNTESTSCKNYTKLPTWTGDPPDWIKCHYWMTKLFSSAKAAGLNEEATKDLLIDKSDGPLYRMLMDEKDSPMSRIIHFIEVQFGQILEPREAEIAVHNLKPYEGESLQIFGQRIMAAIKPASRIKIDQKERTEYEETLGRAILFKNARTWIVTWAANEEKRNIQNGGVPWNYQMLLTKMAAYASANNVRKSRERKEFAEVKKRPNKYKNKLYESSRVQRYKEESESEEDGELEESSLGDWYIQKAKENQDSESESETESNSSESDSDKSEPEDIDKIERLVQDIQKLGKKYDKGKFRKKRFDKKPDKKSGRERKFRDKEQSKVNVVDCTDKEREYGTPMPLRVSWPSLPKDQLPKLAKVEKGVCFKCGMKNPPHLANDPACPLYGEDFMDRACYACGKGLHTWQKCPLAKTSTHLHPADKRRKN